MGIPTIGLFSPAHYYSFSLTGFTRIVPTVTVAETPASVMKEGFPRGTERIGGVFALSAVLRNLGAADVGDLRQERRTGREAKQQQSSAYPASSGSTAVIAKATAGASTKLAISERAQNPHGMAHRRDDLRASRSQFDRKHARRDEDHDNAL